MDIRDLRILDAEGNRYILVPEEQEHRAEQFGNDIPLLRVTPAQGVATAGPEVPIPPSFGSIFKQRREDANITQEDIERVTGIRQSNICTMEKGRRNPRARTQQRYIAAWEQLTQRRWE